MQETDFDFHVTMKQSGTFVGRLRRSRKTLLFIVYLALLLDYMLLTTVGPILPDYLYRLDHPNATSSATTKVQLSATATPVKQSEITNNPSTSSSVHNSTLSESGRIGLLMGSNALVQMITSLFVGPLINRVGYKIPMVAGCAIVFASTLTFAIGDTYGMLFLARSIQGAGSACTNAAGLGMLAQAYPNDKERGVVIGIALGGLAMGILIGPPFGGVLYQWAGKTVPFMILAVLALIDGALRLFIVSPKANTPNQKGPSMKSLIKDPYIAVANGAATMGCLGLIMLGPSLPLWMNNRMHVGAALQGLAFLPNSFAYLVASNAFGPLAHRIGRWLCAMLGLIITGICLMTLPSATSFYGLVAPMAIMGIAIGMSDVSMVSEMGRLADLRYSGGYGSVYALYGAAMNVAFAFGPMICGPIVQGIGFPGLMYLMGTISIAFAPLLFFLRRVPAPLAETEPLLRNGDIQLRQGPDKTEDQDLSLKS